MILTDVENGGIANVLSQRRVRKYISVMGHIQMIFSWLNVSLENAYDDRRRLSKKLDGFFIDENPYDAIYLDDIIFRDLTAADNRELEKLHYYGCVPLTAGICGL